MPERSLEAYELKGTSLRTIGTIAIIAIVLIVIFGLFAIIPAGHRGVVLWWGSLEKRIMAEGFNFKMPIVEKVIRVDVRVRPHPFKEIDASSKEY